jgi:hypothetical protein
MVEGEISKEHRDNGCVWCKSKISIYWFEYDEEDGPGEGGLFCLHCFKYAYYSNDMGSIEDGLLSKLIHAYNMLMRSPWFKSGISFEIEEL